MEEIVHSGKIVDVSGGLISVEILSESACSACHAKGLCGLGESKTKVVCLPMRGWDDYKVGDEVKVSLKASMGHKAVWIAYVAPLMVLLAVLMALLGAGMKDVAAAALAFAAVAVYYLTVWLCRDRLRNEYIFNIKK